MPCQRVRIGASQAFTAQVLLLSLCNNTENWTGKQIQGKRPSTHQYNVPSFWEEFLAVFYVWLLFSKGAAAYQLGNTSSRTITEVKQR